MVCSIGLSQIFTRCIQDGPMMASMFSKERNVRIGTGDSPPQVCVGVGPQCSTNPKPWKVKGIW